MANLKAIFKVEIGLFCDFGNTDFHIHTFLAFIDTIIFLLQSLRVAIVLNNNNLRY